MPALQPPFRFDNSDGEIIPAIIERRPVNDFLAGEIQREENLKSRTPMPEFNSESGVLKVFLYHNPPDSVLLNGFLHAARQRGTVRQVVLLISNTALLDDPNVLLWFNRNMFSRADHKGVGSMLAFEKNL